MRERNVRVRVPSTRPRRGVGLVMTAAALLGLAALCTTARPAVAITACTGGSGAPVCDGTCPAGEECLHDGGVCFCLPLCDPLVEGAPVCNGTCPAGSVCDEFQGCHCLPACETLAPSTCAVSGGAAGGCPHPLVCDGAGGSCQCVVPTLTEWGVGLMALLMLGGVVARRRALAPSRARR